VADAPAVVSQPSAAADAVGEAAHLVEHRVHGGHDVHPVHLDALAARRAQRRVEHGTVLGRVDPLAAEHRVAAAGDVDRAGEIEQQAQRALGGEMLRRVERPAGAVDRHAFGAARILGEEPAQRDRAELVAVDFERPPGGQRAERRRHAVFPDRFVRSASLAPGAPASVGCAARSSRAGWIEAGRAARATLFGSGTGVS
jgi:hypothetical protein